MTLQVNYEYEKIKRVRVKFDWLEINRVLIAEAKTFVNIPQAEYEVDVWEDDKGFAEAEVRVITESSTTKETKESNDKA